MTRTLAVAFGLVAGLASVGSAAGETAASPAERKIEEARGADREGPERCQGHAELALALARRARETSDPAFYVQAEQALETCLAIAPDDFGGAQGPGLGLPRAAPLRRGAGPCGRPQQARARRRHGVRPADRRAGRAGQLQRGGGGLPLDARPAARQRARPHASRLPARAVRRPGGSARAHVGRATSRRRHRSRRTARGS